MELMADAISGWFLARSFNWRVERWAQYMSRRSVPMIRAPRPVPFTASAIPTSPARSITVPHEQRLRAVRRRP